MRRLGLVGAVAALVVLASPPAARADSAAPGNYRSEVTGLEPASDAVMVEVVGGDAFLEVTAAPGTEVEIPGYEGEPYVRIAAGGAVEVNRNSPSYWVNEDRYAQTEIPPSASTDAIPDWEVVGSGGSYGWHDHRIHWMSPEPPPVVDRASRSPVLEWVVPIAVDGQTVSVAGTLEWLPAISPVPWILGAAVVAAAAIWLGSATWALMLGCVLSLMAGLAQAVTSPLGVWAESLGWLPPAIGLGLAVGAGLVPRMELRLLALGAVLLAVWASLRLSSMWMPVLPTPLPAVVERASVATAAGAAGAAMFAVYLRAPRA